MTSVLLVEDTAETRAALVLQLRALKIKDVTTAEDGEEALLFIDIGHDFDVILCDWHMKPMDGLQFCVMMRRHLARLEKPPIPIILMTADSRVLDPVERAKALPPGRDIGIVEILAKPVTTTTLGDVIARHRKPAK